MTSERIADALQRHYGYATPAAVEAIAALLRRAEPVGDQVAQLRRTTLQGDEWAEVWKGIATERSAKIAELRALLRERDGEVWIWESDSDNHLDTLTCPVLITADALRALVKWAEPVGEQRTEVYNSVRGLFCDADAMPDVVMVNGERFEPVGEPVGESIFTKSRWNALAILAAQARCRDGEDARFGERLLTMMSEVEGLLFPEPTERRCLLCGATMMPNNPAICSNPKCGVSGSWQATPAPTLRDTIDALEVARVQLAGILPDEVLSSAPTEGGEPEANVVCPACGLPLAARWLTCERHVFTPRVPLCPPSTPIKGVEPESQILCVCGEPAIGHPTATCSEWQPGPCSVCGTTGRLLPCCDPSLVPPVSAAGEEETP